MPQIVCMRVIWAVCCLCVFIPAAVRAESLLIQQALIVSGEDMRAGPAQDVLVENGVITQIGSVRHQADRTIDARGQYLIPGLIDTHVHLAGVPGERPGSSLPVPVATAAATQIPRSYLYFGFTTLLDLAGDADRIARWNQQSVAPRAYFCVGVTVPGGYPLMWLEQAAQSQSPLAAFMLYDAAQDARWPATQERDPHRPEQLIARIKKTGARCVKTYYETGFGPWRDLPVPSPAAMTELVQAAHAADLAVYMHGNSETAYRFALVAGVDVLVHGLWHSESDAAVQQELIWRVARRGIRVQPTLQVLVGERELFNAAFFDDAQSRAVIPASLLRWYQSEPGQWMRHELARSFGESTSADERYTRAKAAYAELEQRVENELRTLAGAHSVLRFGSDTPSGPFYTQFPGLNGYREIQSWARAGVAPDRIFRALTIDNARLLGLEHEIGQVKIGLRADLLLLKTNPLVTAQAYDSLVTVIQGGNLIPRETLKAH